MNDARPTLPNSRNLGTKSDAVASDGAGLFAQHRAWLATLKTGDVVLVRNGKLHFRANVTYWTPCFVFCEKLKFRRDDGWLTTRQSSRAYQMKLRLVRSEKDMQ